MRRRSENTDEIIKKRITQIVKETLFHNFAKAKRLYSFYNINLFDKKVVKDLLFSSVEYRHHAVHRNGCDLEGNKLDVYSKDYISKILDAMMEVSKNLNEAILKIENDKLPF